MIHEWTWSLLAIQLWQVTALSIVALAINQRIGRRRPHLSHLLGAVVLLKCLTPPVVAAPWSVFGWAENALQPSAEAPRQAAPIKMSDGYWPAPQESLVVLEAGSAMMPTEPTVSGQIPVQADWNWNLHWLLAGAWGAVALAFLAVMAVRCGCRLRVVFRARVDCPPPLQQTMDDLITRLRLRRRVRLLVTRCAVGPAVVGLFRPTIILPQSLVEGRDQQQLQPIVAHELIHIRRGDLWMGMVQWIVQSLWWFHPLVWWASRLVDRDAERCCDEEVITEMNYKPACYARMLLDVLSRKHELTPMPVFPGVRPVDVTSQRLERIMRLRQGSLRRTPWSYRLIALAAAMLVLPGTWAGLRAQENSSAAGDKGDRAGSQVEPWKRIAPQDNAVRLTKGEVPTIVRTYSLAAVKPHLKDAGISMDGLVALLKNFHYADPGPEGNAGQDPQHSAAAKHAFYSPDEKEEYLVVAHTQQGHERVGAALESMARYGFHQICVETQVISLAPEVLGQMNIPWRVLDSQSPPSAQVQLGNLDAPPLAANEPPASSAAYTVKKQLPTLIAKVSSKQKQRILQRIQGDTRSNLMTCPKVTLFSGQVAEITDMSQYPFVVGVQRNQADHEELESKIQIAESGWRLKLRAIRIGDSIWLDGDTKFSSIRGIDNVDMPIQLKGKPVSLQIPEVAAMQIRFNAKVNDSQSLLLYSVKDSPKSKEALIMMITPEAIEEAANEAAEEEDAKEETRHVRHILHGGVVDSMDDARDTPSDAQVAQLLPPADDWEGVVLPVSAQQNVRIIKEKIADYVDPPRFYPLIGVAQLHHAHYKCTVFVEAANGNAKIQPVSASEHSAVVYVDSTHLLLAESDDEQNAAKHSR
ncbi:MAG: M56 family metallopeptidase [Pirellulales bacterium]|nr:M56 family metallopeptidase [Pirellulales bacterium]